MLTAIIIVLILLFILCWYIESNYKYSIPKTSRSPSWGPVVIGSFLITVARWFLVTFGFLFCQVIMLAQVDAQMALGLKWDASCTILYILIDIFIYLTILWFLYMRRLTGIIKQINFNESQLLQILEIKLSSRGILAIVWIFFLIVILLKDTLMYFKYWN